ncbi:MAG: hypothetical protein PHG75_01475 [Syntrophomonas sp.]|nr:hypothetical protein [Syntrophomonas sp.]
MTKNITFSKWIIRIALVQGFLMMWASYALALFNRAQIAEALSKTVCIEIVAIVLGYYLKAGAENMSKNNQWPDKGGIPIDCADKPSDQLQPDSVRPTIYASDSDTSLGISPVN